MLVTAAEVLQELLNACLPVERLQGADAASRLARARTTTIWPVTREDVALARTLPGGVRRCTRMTC